MRNTATRICVAVALGMAAPTLAFGASGFELTSTAFADGEIMDSRYAAKGGPRKCDGENVSPAMAWTHAPEGTKSFALVATDSVARRGQGVTHWVLYNIPGASQGLDEGAAPDGATGGVNITGKPGYFGPCPDVGDVAHHYEFMLLALDIEVGELESGLDWPALKAVVNEHTLGATSLVGRYARH